MKNRQLFFFFLQILCVWKLSAFPPISRQQQIPQNYEEAIVKWKEMKKEERIEEKEEKKKQKKSFYQHYRSSYLAHQKNRLIQFSDRDGFIWFRDYDNKYSYFLSNFYPTSLKIWNMNFSCAEAAFQAAKFLHQPEIAVRFTYLDGEEAWKLAQKLSYQQRGDWYQVREKIMLEVLQRKFQQHEELAELLLATGEAYLVEHTSRDAFWADGGDGAGKNRLGDLLMQVRAEQGGIGYVAKPGKYKKFAN